MLSPASIRNCRRLLAALSLALLPWPSRAAEDWTERMLVVANQSLPDSVALARYYAGAEPRVRRALLLRKLGRVDDADASLARVLIEFSHAPKFVRKAQAEWIAAAEKALHRRVRIKS